MIAPLLVIIVPLAVILVQLVVILVPLAVTLVPLAVLLVTQGGVRTHLRECKYFLSPLGIDHWMRPKESK